MFTNTQVILEKRRINFQKGHFFYFIGVAAKNRTTRQIICEFDRYTLLSQAIGKVWTYYFLLFEFKHKSTILAAIIKKLILHLRETVGKMYLKLRGSVKLKLCVGNFKRLKQTSRASGNSRLSSNCRNTVLFLNLHTSVT